MFRNEKIQVYIGLFQVHHFMKLVKKTVQIYFVRSMQKDELLNTIFTV